MKLKRLSVPSPLFLGKTNLGVQLDTERKADISLEYSPDKGTVQVSFNGETAIIPIQGCYLIPFEVVASPAKAVPKISSQPVKAQVSTPQGDLMTPGKGKTGQEKA